MASGGQLRSSDRRSRAPRRVYTGYMGRPRLFRSLADLSADLADAAQTVLSASDEMRQIFVVPPQEFPSWAKYRFGPAHALIFTDAGVIHVQTAACDQPAQARLAPTGAVHYIQVGLLLLYGRLEIGYAADGRAQQMVVEFNTVGWDLLQPGLMELLRDVSAAPPPPDFGERLDRARRGLNRAVETEDSLVSAAEIERLPFKFANGVKIYILSPGERLLALAFQPGLWTRRLLIFRRQLTPPIVLALTDRCVSMIEEERSVGGSHSYGSTFTYIPRRGVMGMRSEPAPLGRLITIELLVEGAEATREVELTTEVAAKWEAQWRSHGGEWRDETLQG